jgi:hypothetical protein
LALRIPKLFADEIGLEENAPVVFQVQFLYRFSRKCAPYLIDETGGFVGA